MADCAADSVPCGTVCVSTLTAVYNCGKCGSICPNTGGGFVAFCSAGVCSAGSKCPSGLIACGGYCYDVSADPFNCGGCAKKCNVGGGGLAACSAGKCFFGSAISSSSSTSPPTHSISSTSFTTFSMSSTISTASSMPEQNSSNVAPGAAAGIGLGCAIAGALLASLIIFLILIRRKRRQASSRQRHFPSDGGGLGAAELG